MNRSDLQLRMTFRPPCFGLFLILISALTVDAGEMASITDVNNAKFIGELKSWSNDKITVMSETVQEFASADLRSVTFEHPKQTRIVGGSLIWLSNGDRIFARAVKVADDKLTVSWTVLGDVNPPAIPLEKVVAVIFDLPFTMADRLRLFADIEIFPPGNDVVMLSNGDRSLGDFQKLDASFVELKTGKSLLKLDRSRVRAIRLNPELTNTKRISPRRAILTLVDGSRFAATSLELTGDQLNLKTPGLGNLTLPISSVASCQMFGERVIPISDYEPTKVEFTPYLSAIWPLVRNANVKHGPLTLRGTEFTTGLGMHSRMSVTYDLRGDERKLQSIVGIDDTANGAGSAVFAVDLDGRRAWTSADVTGKSTPISVPEVDLKGVKKLTLVVDFGQFADVSDHADWCDAVLILDRAR